MKIKEIKHVILGIAFNPAGAAMGAQSVAEANKTVSEIAQGYDEVQTHVLRTTKDEAGDPAFVQNEYIFIKYAEEVATAKAK